ncbi:MAG: hypothetical protein LC725_01930, partial [Lentisphaerae bacterium]|nr:hypothetical protein [Lentisphaerota bacterium]
VLLMLLIWVNELQGISDYVFGTKPDHASLIRAGVLSGAVLLTAFITIGNTYLQQKRVLSSLISVCAKCHRIRLNKDTWQQMEDYLTANSLMNFSHGLCPDCMEETMQEIKQQFSRQESAEAERAVAKPENATPGRET